MQNKLVDVHVKSLRPAYDNLKEWCSKEENVYIGRGGIVFVDKKRYPPVASKWCNPFTSKKYGSDLCMDMYEAHLNLLLEDEANLKEFLMLEGKTLGCWCAPARCHGDIIIRKLKELKEDR